MFCEVLSSILGYFEAKMSMYKRKGYEIMWYHEEMSAKSFNPDNNDVIIANKGSLEYLDMVEVMILFKCGVGCLCLVLIC